MITTNMKKIITVAILTITTFSFAQKASKDYTFFENSAKNSNNADDPGLPGDGDPGAPIDGYVPVLALVGLGMVVYFSIKQLVMKKY